MVQGNIVAALVLLAWPFIAVAMFRMLSPSRALISNILVAYLFLPPVPAGFDFPLLPPLTKDSIPNIILILICLTMVKEKIEWVPRNRICRALVLIFVLSPMLTVLTNRDVVVYEHEFLAGVGTWLPALRFTEAVAICMQQALFLTPFILARHFLRTGAHLRDLLLAFVVGGLVYSIFALIEIRLSPQINLWVYGFYQHDFAQSIRFGGFRPLVFLYHGIWLAFFMMTAVIAAFALLRMSQSGDRMRFGFAGLYLLAVLILCKSAAAILFAALLLPLVPLPVGWQLRAALAFGLFAISYPVMKQADLLPEERLLSAIEDVNAERANSLRFRFANEEVLLDRAYERPLFGWGSWGRNHLLNPETGEIMTVTDGRWVIVIGVYGWLGFLAEFGLLILPLAVMWYKGAHRNRAALSPLVGPIALILGINVLDLLPNATITPLTWLFAGALLGYAESYKSRTWPKMAPAFRTVLQ